MFIPTKSLSLTVIFSIILSILFFFGLSQNSIQLNALSPDSTINLNYGNNTKLVIENNQSINNQLLCVYIADQSVSSAVLLQDLKPSYKIDPGQNGETYSLFLVNNTQTCFNGSSFGLGNFQLYPRHTTTIKTTFNNNVFGLTSQVANNSPKYTTNNGNLRVDICLNSPFPVTVDFVDPDGDRLSGAASTTPYNSYYLTNTRGNLNYYVYPTYLNSTTLGATQTQTFTAKELPNSYQYGEGAVVSVLITFVTVNCNQSSSSNSISASSIPLIVSSSALSSSKASSSTSVLNSSLSISLASSSNISSAPIAGSSSKVMNSSSSINSSNTSSNSSSTQSLVASSSSVRSSSRANSSSISSSSRTFENPIACFNPNGYSYLRYGISLGGRCIVNVCKGEGRYLPTKFDTACDSGFQSIVVILPFEFYPY